MKKVQEGKYFLIHCIINWMFIADAFHASSVICCNVCSGMSAKGLIEPKSFEVTQRLSSSKQRDTFWLRATKLEEPNIPLPKWGLGPCLVRDLCRLDVAGAVNHWRAQGRAHRGWQRWQEDDKSQPITLDPWLWWCWVGFSPLQSYGANGDTHEPSLGLFYVSGYLGHP